MGDVVRLAPFTVTPQAGLRISHVSLGGFSESGSEVALNVNRTANTSSALIAGVEAGLDAQHWGAWAITPAVMLGTEMAHGSTHVASSGNLYGYSITQYAGYDSRYLLTGGLGVHQRKQHGSVSAAKGQVSNALHGDGATGVDGQLSVAYRF